MSVTPAASQTRVLAGTGIKPSAPGSIVCGGHAPLDYRLRGGFRAMAEVCS
jgi:hypothetical protein